MFVAASTRCFGNLPLEDALSRLADLEFSYVEIVIHESAGHLKPSQVAANLEEAVQRCRHTQRLTPIAYSIDIEAPKQEYFQHFVACCRLAKATRVVTLTVRSAELGTPFNAEVERLQEMVRIATIEGVRVGLLTEGGRMTEDPATAAVLCEHVKGLAITLDPSHFICGARRGCKYEKVLPHVCHVRLRDSRRDQFQVRVGQGEMEYGRLIGQLNRNRYDRALTIDTEPMPGVDQNAELRKFRLLLESLL